MNKKNTFRLFLLLWFGRLITEIGTGVSSFSLSIFVFKKTGMATASSLILFVAFVPSLVLSLPAGVLADRFDRRKLMVLGDSLSAIGLLVLLYFTYNSDVGLGKILLCVGLSSVFASLIEPAYKSSISDLLNEEDYTKGNGLVQLAYTSKYLISPIVAGFIMKTYGISLALLLDILTIVPTIFITYIVANKVKKHTPLSNKVHSLKNLNIIDEVGEGMKSLRKNKGILSLSILGFFITFCLGGIQTLLTPLILSFTTSNVLGTITSVSASGMLISSLILGVLPIRKDFQKILSYSLTSTGICMIGFGWTENIFIITSFGFMLFASLPFANATIDYLVRRNLDKSYEGRLWALIGVISQLGNVVAYGIIGMIADKIFTPLMLKNGVFSNSIGKIIGVGSGRGIGLLIIILGVGVIYYSIKIRLSKNIRQLEG